MDVLKEIEAMLEKADIDPHYTDDFLELLAAASDDDVAVLVEAFREDQIYLELMYKSYAGKKKAMETGSEEALQAVLEEEYRILKMLENTSDEPARDDRTKGADE